MAIGKLAEIAAFSAAMPALVALGLWGSVELLSLAGLVQTQKSAPEQLEGMIVKMDKVKHEIILKHWAPGQTAGAANAPADPYRLEYDPSFDNFKAGDQVEFTTEQIGGVWTI